MRFILCLFVFGILAVAVSWAYPAVEEDYVAEPVNDAAEALFAVDAQGHENEGDRQARQFGFGGYRGGYGGYGGGHRHGGYGGFGGGYGGYRGGYGGYGGGYGGHRGGYGGFYG